MPFAECANSRSTTIRVRMTGFRAGGKEQTTAGTSGSWGDYFPPFAMRPRRMGHPAYLRIRARGFTACAAPTPPATSARSISMFR